MGERIVERIVNTRPAIKIGIGTGILVVLYFIYVLCKGGFSLAALASAAISLVIGAVVWVIILLAALMILDGLLSIGE